MCFQLLNAGICLWQFAICLVRCWCKEHLWEQWQEWRGYVIKDAWGKIKLYRDNCWELSHRLHLCISQDFREVWAHSWVEKESRSEVESVVYGINKCLHLFALANNDCHNCDTFCGSFCDKMGLVSCLFGSVKLKNSMCSIAIIFKKATHFYGSLDGFIWIMKLHYYTAPQCQVLATYLPH